MLFQGILYALLFLACTVIFSTVRSRGLRQAILLIASYALYMTWGVWFAAVLLSSTVMNFLVGEWLRRKPSGAVLSIGILLNLTLLAAFKYFPEIAINISLASLQRFSHLALPL